MPSKIVSASSVGQGVRSAGGVGSDFIRRDVSIPMTLIAPFQTPFLNYLFLSNMVRWRYTGNLQGLCEFPERELVPTVDTINATSAGGSTTITITPAEPNLYVVGKAVKFLDTDETGIITTAGATTFVATRDPDSSGNARNWTAPTVQTKIKLLGEARGENDSTIEAVYMNPYMRKSRVQIMEKSIKMTDMMIAASMGGDIYGGDWWANQNEDTIAAMKIDMENAMWFNENHFSSITNGMITTKTEGIIYQIANNGGLVFPYGATLDKADWKEFLRSMKLGNKKKTVFAGNNVSHTIEDIIETNYSNVKAITRYGPLDGDDTIEVLQYRVDGLIVDVIRNPQWDEKYENYAVALDDANVYGLAFKPDKKGPRRFRIEIGVQADGTPREESKILMHVGVGISGCPTCGILKP